MSAFSTTQISTPRFIGFLDRGGKLNIFNPFHIVSIEEVEGGFNVYTDDNKVKNIDVPVEEIVNVLSVKEEKRAVEE